MIYLDNSATTKPVSQAVLAVNRAMTELWGNASSVHAKGIETLEALDSARKTVAGAMKCSPGEVYFTPGGTYANLTAIMGAAAKGRRGSRVITTAVEHPSVLKAFDTLERRGYDVVRLKTDSFGRPDFDELEQALGEETCLVSMMTVNNELGTVTDVAEAAKLVHKKAKYALFHTDAVQAFGKLDISPSKTGADLISVSSHKIHGPKGAGALYVRKGIHLEPFITGGGQERGLVSGTEPIPAILGFAAAAEAQGNMAKSLEHARSLRDFLVGKLTETGHVHVNSPEDALPYILNVSLEGVPSQPAVNALSEAGVMVSAGSACKRGHRSEVLDAVGLDPRYADTAIRISFSRFNTIEEIEEAARVIISTIERIRR